VIKALKWIGIILGILVGLVVIAIAAVYFIAEEKLTTVYDLPAAQIIVPNDPQVIERGKHLVTAVVLCDGCHGKDYSGELIDEGPLIGRIVMSNLTGGKGGIGGKYTDADWERALRHGVRPDGRALLLMPSSVFYFLSNSDVAAIIAYLNSLPPVDNDLPKTKLGILGRLFVLQDPALLSAALINHNAPRPPAVEPAASKEYGEYLANVCKNCHGNDLAGGEQVDSGVNLTPGDELAHWTYDDFIQVMRFGLKPDGTQLDGEKMPWPSFQNMNDIELEALWLFLQSLPPVESKVEASQP